MAASGKRLAAVGQILMATGTRSADAGLDRRLGSGLVALAAGARRQFFQLIPRLRLGWRFND